MKKIIISTVLLFSVACFAPKTAVKAGASPADALKSAAGDATTSFIRSISDYYIAPEKEVAAIQAKGIPYDEIPVVYYIAREAKVAPATVTKLRLDGDSWQEISDRYGYGAEKYYVPIKANEDVGPPYGHAYGYYKNKPKSQWKNIKLEDDDIVNLVNLKFMSNHYKYPAATIMKMRRDSRGFSVIGADIDGQRKANKERAKAAKDKKEKVAPGHANKRKAPAKNKRSVKKAKKAKNPDHLTGTKKQVDKVKKFYKKKNKKAKKFINDKG